MNFELLRPEVRRGPLDASRFLHPRQGDRPGMRWWWQSPVPPEELVRELRAIAEAGFGEVEIAFSPEFWANEAQRQALGIVLEEAGRLGIGVASTLGAAWPLQTPNTGKGTENAAKELQYGVSFVHGADPCLVAIPGPFDDPDRRRGGQLVAATMGRVLARGPRATATTVHDAWRGDVQVISGPDTATVLEAASLRDVTGELQGDGLRWDGGDGEWAVFGFWMRDTVQGVTSFLDRRAAIAATEYIDAHQIGVENSGRLAHVGTDLFEDSLELNADSLFWSPGFLDRFRSRHGYDPTAFLPVLFAHGMCRYWVPNEEPVPDFELDTGTGARVRQDYYRLLTDLYIDDHLIVLQDWAAGHGLRHKAQVAYGQNLEPVRSNREFVRHGGRAEGESLNSGDRAPVNREHPTWRYALDWQRAVVGGAHQGGGVRISTELGAQFAAAYRLSLGDLKQLLDKEWAAGITKPFVHGFASQEADAPWPTQPRFFDYVADSWNDTHFPEWKHWRPLTDYWARGTVALETGIPRTDVAVYRDGFLTTAARGSDDADMTTPSRLFNADRLERAGYSIQFVDPIGLAQAGADTRDGQLFPDGPAYRAVIVDERAVTPESIEALDAAAAHGLRVIIIGEAPIRDSGFADETGDARVQHAMSRLLRRPSVRQITDITAAAETLLRLGVPPRTSVDGHALLTQWRNAGTSRYVLVYNTEGTTIRSTLSLEGRGTLRELDLWSGEFSDVESALCDGRTKVSLSLAPLDLRIFELQLVDASARTSPPDGLSASARRDSAQREVPLGTWTLEVNSEEPSGARSIRLDGQGPGDWRGIKELATVSGAGKYRVEVQDDAGSNAAIDLGELAGSATVRVDGRVLGTAYVSHWTVPSGTLKAGSVIEIEVRTPLCNAVVAAGNRPGVGADTRAHGLIGPVRVFAPD